MAKTLYKIFEGSLEVKLPTIWTDGKVDVGRVREEKRRREGQRKKKVRRKKTQVREKVGKSRFTAFFPKICGSGGSKSGLAKAAGAEPCGQMRDEKLHAVVARSTFGNSKDKKNLTIGPLFEVEMSKKCTPLWREAHFQVKSVKNWRVGTTFWRSDVVLRGRCKGFCTFSKAGKNVRFCSSFNYNHQYTTLHHTTSDYATLHYTTFHYITLRYNTLHYTTLRYTSYSTVHYNTPHYNTLHYNTLHYTPFHFTTLRPITVNHTTLN